MTRDQLEHAIRAACDVSEDTEVIIFGSQAILGSFPSAPEELRTSIEVDLQPKNRPENTDQIDGTLGELSRFHQTHGFYVHGVTIDGATLPAGWEGRMVTVRTTHGTGGNTGYCLEAHDLAASKLVANREKDRLFVTILLIKRLIDGAILLKRIKSLPLDSSRIDSMSGWIRSIVEEID